jgi:hypothetical protein
LNDGRRCDKLRREIDFHSILTHFQMSIYIYICTYHAAAALSGPCAIVTLPSIFGRFIGAAVERVKGAVNGTSAFDVLVVVFARRGVSLLGLY